MFLSNLALAFREIRRNLFRSALTVLGVVIGVAAVVSIVTIGNGASAAITERISSLGANLIIVSPGSGGRGPGGPGGMSGRSFTMEDVQEIRKSVYFIQSLTPTSFKPVFISTERTEQPSFAIGATPNYFITRDIKIEQGKQFEVGSKEVVLGAKAAKELFGRTSIVGESLELEGEIFTVAGVLEETTDGPFGFNQNKSILIPLTTMHRLWDKNQEISSILVKAVEADKVGQVKESLKELLRARRGLTEGMKSDFRIRGVDQIVDTVKETTGVITAVIGSIAGISLLVGGIGIMNVMLVTVTERTREVGVKMAIGAEASDVLWQFLVESSMLSAWGGLMGIGLGLGGGAIAAHFIEIPFTPNASLVLGAFGFSVVLGIVFGYLPARRAAKLNPIEALRHE